MQTLPFLKRYLAAGLTAAIITAVVIVYSLTRPGNNSLFEPAANAQPAGKGEPGWTMFGGSPSRNMVNLKAKDLPVKWTDDEGDLIKANVLWTADLGSRSYGGPIVAGGRVFVGTNNQSPRDKKDRTVKGTEKDDIVTKVAGQPVKNDDEIQKVVASLPLGEQVECAILRDGKTVMEKLPVRPTDLGVLMVFDQADGKFLYQTTFAKLPAGQVCDWPLEGLCSTPTVEGERMYYTSNRCEMICANIATGAFVWKLDMMKQLGVFPHNLTASCPLIVGDDVYIVTANGVDEGHINVPAPTAPSFLKMNKMTGKVLWSDNSPTIKLTLALAPKKDKGVKDKDAGRAEQEAFFKNLVNRGELIQHGQWSNPAYAVVGGEPQVIWPGGEGWLYSFTPAGKLIWKFDCNPKDARYELGGRGTRSDFIATPVIYKDRVYIAVGQDPEHNPGVGHLWCIDMNKKGDVSPELVTDNTVFPPKTKPNPNSAKVWHFGGFIAGGKGRRNFEFGRTMATCAIHDDILYTAELGGMFHCLDAMNGKVLWEHDTRSLTWSSPYWADGKVYFGTDKGDVFVFAHGKTKKLLAKNEMGLAVRATPVAAGGILYVVSGNKLYALKK